MLVWTLLPLMAYLVGSFPTGVVLSRRKYGIDIRDMGSGNIGATNIARNFGWKAGTVTFLIDGMKGYFCVQVAQAYGGDWPWSLPLVGAAVVLGHCYSVFLEFRGGKGVATSLGCLFAGVPWAGWLMGFVYLVLLWMTRISAIGSLGGMAVAVNYVSFVPVSVPVRVMVYGMAGIVLVRHQSNIRRLFAGLRSR